MLNRVGIPDPASRLDVYINGMSQRVMIAMAIACRPKLLIADGQPLRWTMTIQAQSNCWSYGEENMALVLITAGWRWRRAA